MQPVNEEFEDNFNMLSPIEDSKTEVEDVVKEEVKETKAKKNDEIVDINIAGVKKTRIRINGDNDSILELNLSDMRIAERLEKGYTKLQQNIQKITGIDLDNENVSKKLNEIDKDMREVVDYIFDTNVSEVCCKNGTMFDLQDGRYRFESILEALTQLYSDTLNSEYRAMKRRVQQNADKYIPQDHKPRASKKRKEIIQKDE